jgi:RNA polymerase sigma factor (sigma-70 family)
MVSAGLLGLAKAIQSYNGTSPLKNWCYRIINSEIIKTRYKNNRERKEVQGYEDFEEQIEDSHDSLQPIYDKEDTIEDANNVNKIMLILNSPLPLLEKDNCLNRRLYIDKIMKGKSFKELSTQYPLTYSAIVHRISKINQLIRDRINVL